MSRSALAGLGLWGFFSTMTKISYAGYRFPSEIIQQAIWLYLRFTLSFRDVEDLLAERGIMISYEKDCVLVFIPRPAVASGAGFNNACLGQDPADVTRSMEAPARNHAADALCEHVGRRICRAHPGTYAGVS
jgi:hypothetical protein